MNPVFPDLIFLKLGGSLITNKDQPESARVEQIEILLSQIAAWREANPLSRLLLGHGSGSFGHHAAARYGTRGGVRTAEEAEGFQQVWLSARRLNQIILDQARAFNLPLISFPPSASITSDNRKILTWNLQPITRALEMDLIPLIYGDVIADLSLGGTILSTEELFVHLAHALHPNRILLAGKEEGVFADFPHNQHLIRQIPSHADLTDSLQGSASQDVTGGMLTKVQSMQALCRDLPDLTVNIFSAVSPGTLLQALNNCGIGTLIH